MGRYTGPKGKLSRREGVNLFLKGSRSFSDKNAVARKPFVPGQHGNKQRVRLSNYGKQLRAKQLVKRVYGVREKQFKNLFIEANRLSKLNNSDKGLELLRLLETRLDNLVYLFGMAPSRSAARQYVVHGHVNIDGKKIRIPSYNVKIGQTVELKSPKLAPDQVLVTQPEWLSKDKLSGRITRLPERDEIDEGYQEHMIVEFYSR